MVKAAEVRDGDNFTAAIFYRARFGRVSIDRQMTAGLIVVALTRQKSSQQMAFAKSDDVIRALSANRTDDALDVRVLPGRLPGADRLFDSHRHELLLEGAAVDRVAITMKVSRNVALTGERFDDLLRRPLGRRVLRDVTWTILRRSWVRTTKQ